MCKSFLCGIYQLELKGARKRLGNIRKLKREHGIDALDIEVENVKQCIVTAKAKIDDLHVEIGNVGKRDQHVSMCSLDEARRETI